MQVATTEILCVSVNADVFEEGLFRLRSGYAILSEIAERMTGDSRFDDQLYGVELLIRDAVEMIGACRTCAQGKG